MEATLKPVRWLLTNHVQDWAQVGSWAPEVELPSEAVRKLVLEKLARETERD